MKKMERRDMESPIKRILLAATLVLALSALPSLEGCKSPGGKNESVPATGGGATAKASSDDLTMAPEVTFKDLQGGDVKLSSFRGKVVIVNFWATWCEPCQIEIPWMIGFQQKYGPKGFTILGVAMDDEGKSVVQPYVQSKQFDVDGAKLGMNYPIVLGNDDLAAQFGGLLGLPTSVVVNRDGKIVKKYIGLVSHDTIDQQIQGLL
jgi:thiol-disulfide isomerase/thioredoxin